MSKSPKISEKLNSLLKELESHIRPLDDLEHIASLMVGKQLSQTANRRKNGEPLNAGVEHLEVALELASNMDHSTVVPGITLYSHDIHEDSVSFYSLSIGKCNRLRIK
jgi:hypothetical protein